MLTGKGQGRHDRVYPVEFLPRCKQTRPVSKGQCFSDYPMRLICASEPMDCTAFRTSLGALFELLPLRRDKVRLKKLMDENPVYQKLDEDTAETAGILMGVNLFIKHRKKYKNGDGYNMCKAYEVHVCLGIREMMEDSRTEGWEAGEKAGREAGKTAGREAGEKVGWEAGIRIFIQARKGAKL